MYKSSICIYERMNSFKSIAQFMLSVDCVENMEDNDAFEWLELKATCDNENQCDYLFRGASFLEGCTVAGDVSYLHVYFMCEPGVISLTLLS